MRKHNLSECDPRWVTHDGVQRTGFSFECPESDGGCQGRHVVPTSSRPNGGATWEITGNLPHITLTPSIACRGACRMHITIASGVINFCPDSKSGPDWSEK